MTNNLGEKGQIIERTINLKTPLDFRVNREIVLHNKINIDIIQNSICVSLSISVLNVTNTLISIFHSGPHQRLVTVTCKLTPHPCPLCPGLWRRLLKTYIKIIIHNSLVPFRPATKCPRTYCPGTLCHLIWHYFTEIMCDKATYCPSKKRGRPPHHLHQWWVTWPSSPDGVRLSELILCFAAWRWCFVTSQWLACSSLGTSSIKSNI